MKFFFSTIILFSLFINHPAFSNDAQKEAREHYTGNKENLNLLVQVQEERDLKCEVLKDGSGNNTKASVIIPIDPNSPLEDIKTFALLQTVNEAIHIIDVELVRNQTDNSTGFLLEPFIQGEYTSIYCY